MDPRETMRSYSSILGILLLTLAPLLCGQEPAPATTVNQTASQSAPQPVQPVAAPAAAAPSVTTTAPYGEIAGVVKSGNVPLPGVTVTAANTLTGKKYST